MEEPLLEPKEPLRELPDEPLRVPKELLLEPDDLLGVNVREGLELKLFERVVVVVVLPRLPPKVPLLVVVGRVTVVRVLLSRLVEVPWRLPKVPCRPAPVLCCVPVEVRGPCSRLPVEVRGAEPFWRLFSPPLPNERLLPLLRCPVPRVAGACPALRLPRPKSPRLKPSRMPPRPWLGRAPMLRPWYHERPPFMCQLWPPRYTP